MGTTTVAGVTVAVSKKRPGTRAFSSDGASVELHATVEVDSIEGLRAATASLLAEANLMVDERLALYQPAPPAPQLGAPVMPGGVAPTATYPNG